MGIHVGLAGMFLEGVGDHQRTEAQLAIEQAIAGKEGGDVAAKAANRAFLGGEQHFVGAGQPGDQLFVEGLEEARIGNGGIEPERGQAVGGREHFAEARAIGEDGDGCALAHDAALADGQDLAAAGHVDAQAIAARIAEGNGAGIIGGGGRHHVAQFGFVGGGHLHDARNGAEIGGVVIAGMGGAIGPDITGPIDGKAHRQVLDRHVMHDLIIGALQEGGIDGAERAHALAGEARRKGDGVLFGNAHVKAAAGEEFGEFIEAGARGHGGIDGDNARIVLGFLDQRLGKDRGIGGRIGDRLGLRPGDDVELGDAVIFVGRVLGGAIALALLGDDMHQHRAVDDLAHVIEHGQQMIEIVPVNGADIVEAQFLEQRAAGEERAGEFLGAARPFVKERRQLLGDRLGGLAHAAIGGARDEARQIRAHRPGGRGNRHVIVVEHDDEPGIHGAGIVHRLIGHAGRHGAIANDRHHIARLAQHVAGDGHAQPCRNRGGGVARAKRIIFALGAAGEAGEAILLAQRADAVAAAGEDLVGIGLVADIPDDPVMGGIKHRMQRHGELDHAQPGAQMAPGDRDGVDHFGAQFIGQLAQVGARQGAQIRRRIDGIKQGGDGLVGQAGGPLPKTAAWTNTITSRRLAGTSLCSVR